MTAMMPDSEAEELCAKMVREAVRVAFAKHGDMIAPLFAVKPSVKPAVPALGVVQGDGRYRGMGFCA